MSRGHALALALASWLIATPAVAYSPIPEFPGPGGVATSGVTFDAAALRSLLATHVSAVGAQYSVLIVNFSDRDDRPGGDFGDSDGVFDGQVISAWGAHADTASGVLITIALSNHDVIVHPFSRFTALGWEGNAVKRTIDESPFGMYARSGDYTQAIFALVLAIDAELDARTARVATDRARLAGTLESARRAVARFERESAASLYDLHQPRAMASALLESVRESESAIARSDWGRAIRSEGTIRAATNNISGWLARAREAEARASTALARLRRARTTFANHPRLGDSPEASRTMRAFGRRLARAQALLTAGAPAQAEATLESAEADARNIDLQLAAAVVQYRFMHRVLPILLLGIVSVLLARALFRRRRETREVVQSAEALLSVLERGLGHAGDKLVTIENENAVFLSGETSASAFIGASQRPVREAASRVDDLFIEFEAATRVAREARAHLTHAGNFGLASAKRAYAALTTEMVVVRTEQVKAKKLLLPDQREVTMAPAELLTKLEKTYAKATQLLDTLGTRIGSIHDRLESVGVSAAACEAAYARVVGRTKSVDLSEVLDALETERRTMLERSKLDPLGCEDDIRALEKKAAALEARLVSLDVASKAGAETVPQRCDALAARVARLREAGRKVCEPTFDPDARIAELRAMVREVTRSLASGDEARAGSSSARALSMLDELEKLCAESETSSSSSQSRVKAERQRATSLRERLPERRERIEALRVPYTDAALAPALDNATEAEPLLAEALVALGRVERELADDVQAYVAAKRALERVASNLDFVEDLYAEIDTKADELAARCEAADISLSEAKLALKRVVGLIAACDAHEPESAHAALAAAQSEVGRIEAMRHETPLSVLALEDDARSLRARVDTLGDELAALSEAIAAAVAQRTAVRDSATALQRSLQACEDDGPRANTGCASAVAMLEAIEDRWAERMADPSAALDDLAEVAAAIENARQLAFADVEIAGSARSKVAAAHAAVRRAEGRLPAQEGTKLAEARRLVAEAQARLVSFDYQEACRLAARASASAETAVRTSNEEAEAKRLRDYNATYAPSTRREARRPRSATPSDSSSIFGSSSSHSSHSSSGSGGFFGSSSSHSSHSSSGSSSFGSSSGSSSFGSSSGRSKW